MSGTMHEQRKRGAWFPWIFVGMFAVIVTVNGIMAFFAVSTFTGLHTERPYEKGLAYNDAIAGAAAQEKLGWVVNAELAAAADGRHGGALKVDVRDEAGAAIEGIDVFALFVRPTQAGHDARIPLVETAEGSFVAEVALPFPGQWEMQVVANRGDASYQINQRVMLP